jgi:hypothetical protein
MPNAAFPRMLTDYLRKRAAAHFPPRELEQLRLHLLDRLSKVETLPAAGMGIDWRRLAEEAGVDGDLMLQAREALRPGLEALRREIAARPRPKPKAERRGALLAPMKKVARPTQAHSAQGRPRGKPKAEPSAKQHFPVAKPTIRSAAPHRRRSDAGRPRRPVVDFPEADSDTWDDPASFHEALALHMRRHRDTSLTLTRAILKPGETFERSTIVTWRRGLKAPRSLTSLDLLRRIEHRYRLPVGYFQAKLPHPARAATGHQPGGIPASEMRRLAWHLPDDFAQRSSVEQEEILEWVRRVVISGATDYRRYQADAMKLRYAVRFPNLQSARAAQRLADRHREDDFAAADSDPELLPGVVRAPARLAEEMAALVSFKTATLTAIGYQRRGVWGQETASQKTEHLGLMFGALVASPCGAVRGYGAPLRDLTFGLLVFPAVWDWYVQWRERRRGFYTNWEVDMLQVAVALTSSETGWITQAPGLLERLRPIPGLVSEDEIDAARQDWPAACAKAHAHTLARAKEIQRVARVHRDPFEPILTVLEADSPVGEYRKIADEIVRLMPDPRRYPKSHAEAVRSLLMVRFGLHLGLRQRNLRELLVCPRGRPHTPDRQLEQARCGELRWNSRDSAWEVYIPSIAFKNAHSSFFAGRPFRLSLPDLGGLYSYIDTWLDRHRSTLLGRTRDPGTFFVKTMKSSSANAAYDQNTFYEAWRLTTQRYGIYNPYTGRGAIPGLLPHGPHNIRDVLATHILKQTGSYEQASYAIQDTPDMVAKHYGRFLPQDKAALAAQVLNQVWAA